MFLLILQRFNGNMLRVRTLAIKKNRIPLLLLSMKIAGENRSKRFVKVKYMTRKVVLKRIGIAAVVLVGILVCIIAGALVSLQVKTNAILNDISDIRNNEKYATPVYIDGIEVITQDVSCGYAVIEMFSEWNGQTITEESLYNEYGRVVTSTGNAFCEEMNKLFPEYTTSIHKYLSNTELIDEVYDNLSRGIPVPFEWAAMLENDWTLHYSLIVGADIPNDKITVANPYGYYEELSVNDFLERTSFKAYKNMPLYLQLGFAFGIFEKNTIFVIQ